MFCYLLSWGWCIWCVLWSCWPGWEVVKYLPGFETASFWSEQNCSCPPWKSWWMSSSSCCQVAAKGVWLHAIWPSHLADVGGVCRWPSWRKWYCFSRSHSKETSRYVLSWHQVCLWSYWVPVSSSLSATATLFCSQIWEKQTLHLTLQVGALALFKP